MITVLAVLIVGLAGYFYFSMEPDSEQQGGILIDDTPESNAASTDWKTYQDVKYRFEVKIPDYYVVEEGGAADRSWLSLSLKKSNVERVSISVNHPGFGLEGTDVISKKKYIVDGMEIEASLLKDVPTASTNNVRSQHILAIWEKNNDEYSFLASFPVDNNEAQKEFEAILATLKFIEKPEINVSAWKTYRSQQYGFEIRYPAELKVDPPGLFMDKVRTEGVLLSKHMELDGKQIFDFGIEVVVEDKSLEALRAQHSGLSPNGASNIKDIVLNGQEGFEKEWAGMGGIDKLVVLRKDATSSYLILLYYAQGHQDKGKFVPSTSDKYGDEYVQKLVTSMLSTFKPIQ